MLLAKTSRRWSHAAGKSHDRRFSARCDRAVGIDGRTPIIQFWLLNDLARSCLWDAGFAPASLRKISTVSPITAAAA